MSTSLRVVSLVAQNMLRLSAININWDKDQSVLTLGGANGAGKSSAVNCVAMALGGMALCPEEPIKRGESHGFVELDLGDLRIRRDFTRSEIHEANCASSPDETGKEPAPCNCKVTYGDVKSRLVVRNAEGITQGTPQAILDKLIGRMTFDPMAFVNEDSKPQEEILRRIVNLDVSEHELNRKTAFERRAVFNRQHRDAVAAIEAMPKYPDAPKEEIAMSEITDALQRASALQVTASNAERQATVAEQAVVDAQRSVTSAGYAVTRLEKELAEARANVEAAQASVVNLTAIATAASTAADTAKAAVPDVSVLTQQLNDADATNGKVRANRAVWTAAENIKALVKQIDEQTAIITNAETAKRAALDAAKFPVPGLSVNDHGVTFNDLPFKQASTAEQIRVSVAIGFALHPKLKLLLVKNGNALDDDSLKLVAAEAAAAGGQILMEYVTKDASDVSVFIEDGHLMEAKS